MLRRVRWGVLRGESGATGVLLALLAVGVALRLLAALAIWPVGLGIDDSAPYTDAASHNVLSDVQAPGGYPALLAALGLVTRQVAAVALLQHLLGLVAAVVFFAAVRRATGSGWIALLPAAGLLLDSDQIYLEHAVMAEGVYAVVLAATMLAAVRALGSDRPERWALLAGGLAAGGGLIRSAGIALVVPIVLALLMGSRARRVRLRSAGAAAAAALAVLAGYAALNYSHYHELSIGPDPGWHLYGMVGHYADCAAFDPPAGTARLCQATPPSQRLGLNFYLYDPRSPARVAFGYFGNDAAVGAFARAVVIHQPGAYLRNVGLNLAGYFVPSVYPKSYGDPLGGQGLSPPLDWKRDNPDGARLAQVMGTFYVPFREHTRPGVRTLLQRWERVFRFGATVLVVSTLLTLSGFLLGASRQLLVLFGGGGLCFLLAPSFIGEYSGRYTVPMVAPMLAAAAIAVAAGWRRLAARRSAARTATARGSAGSLEPRSGAVPPGEARTRSGSRA